MEFIVLIIVVIVILCAMPNYVNEEARKCAFQQLNSNLKLGNEFKDRIKYLVNYKSMNLYPNTNIEELQEKVRLYVHTEIEKVFQNRPEMISLYNYTKDSYELKKIIDDYIVKFIEEKEYQELKNQALNDLGLNSLPVVSHIEEQVTVKSRQALTDYDIVNFFKENKSMLVDAEDIVNKKNNIAAILCDFLTNNKYKSHTQYPKLQNQINEVLKYTNVVYRIKVQYISSAGNNLGEKVIIITQQDINELKNNPSLLMTKEELKKQNKDILDKKQQEYYKKINNVITYANDNKDFLIMKNSENQIDNLIAKLFNCVVNNINKIKVINSEEWNIIDNLINQIDNDVKNIVNENRKILDYYESSEFLEVKNACKTLINSQKDFNEYIAEKVQSISNIFGTKINRNETINNDQYNYIRHYKKTITPYTAEVSATIFASAENNPLEYIIKHFYPNRNEYPMQIQRLKHLIEELETLKDARQIIENYKKEYQEYIANVPDYVMQNDEAGFYSRLGFTNIDESVLIVEYKFVYTSNGGMAQRSFTVSMTEENIIELIKRLENKLTTKALEKEQRAMMTAKLREFIKNRDNYTCCNCGNSTHAEPNLLLEIDHIIPISKGGCTVEENLQTLCWKCNRAKSNKITN